MNNKFSVLLSIYAKENPDHFDQCMQSITAPYQTLPPAEIVLIEDGPLTPELYARIKKWKNKKDINLIIKKLDKNQGLANALNVGLDICSFDLIARMDTDDEAHPERFKKQYEFMSNNPEISISSGTIEEYDQNLEKKLSTRHLPQTYQEVRDFSKIRSPISHPACMYRRNIIIKLGKYPNLYPEDYALWGIALSKNYKIANIPDTLLKMRAGNSISQRRGLIFLKGEIKTYLLFHKIGLTSFWELTKAIIIKSVVRLSPNFIKKILYTKMR